MTSNPPGPPLPPSQAPPPEPGKPIRWWAILLGIGTSVVLLSALNGIAGLFLPHADEDQALTTILVYLPIGIAVLSLLILVGGVLMTIFGDRGYGIGLLTGWALGLIVGAGVCVAVISTVQPT